LLLQSQDGKLHLLPALPPTWRDGSIAGLRARGALTVDIAWRGGVLTGAVVTADVGGPVTLAQAMPVRDAATGRRVACRGEGGGCTFAAVRGRSYRLG
jgi:alpha-L-fucosidase 2